MSKYILSLLLLLAPSYSSCTFRTTIVQKLLLTQSSTHLSKPFISSSIFRTFATQQKNNKNSNGKRKFIYFIGALTAIGFLSNSMAPAHPWENGFENPSGAKSPMNEKILK